MSAYMVISVTPQDEDKFREYEAATLSVVGRYGGVPIARDVEPLVLETDAKPALAVILRFDSKQAVEAFYHSDDYAPLKEFRHTFAEAHALVIEGP
ncbi:DUF1330 domain-containing protein [Actinomadura viridis]|uniref:Uncharacterized protein (DUF1330 family) n=1 Tax=Actinomadura viridis TaxID=58110 RepID=A0A931DMR8_9ACTN|nr:DUF1330 domain-containing protein [Actinomadura viridis]MBG6090446.1 uncharacterized protein (DUF1330 family) [Actinomadura viridis]